MESIEVLIPCMHLDREGIKKLYAFLKVNSDALFACQCDRNAEEEIEIDGHSVHIIYSTSRGVSKNRNLLLLHARGDILLMIDDDCVLADDYVASIYTAYGKYPDADAIRFNTTRVQNGQKCRMVIKDKRASFKDVSAYGTPGLSLNRERFSKYDVLFDENLGVPNYLANGEDSLFLYDLTKKSKHFYVVSAVIANVLEDKKESTWFKGYNDVYFITKGYIFHKMYPHLYSLVAFYHYLNQKKQYSSAGYKYSRYKKLIRAGRNYKVGEKYEK